MIKQPDFSVRVEGEQIVPAKHERQAHEPYDDFSRRTRKWQWLKAGFACVGLHAAVAILVYLLTVVFLQEGKMGMRIVAGYVLIGWLPLIKLYPLLLRKLD